jgi:DNA-binding NarL/FixJ family response regulator
MAALVLSLYVEPDYAMRLIQTYPGGMGYLLKERILESAFLLDAVRRLAEGECVIDPTTSPGRYRPDANQIRWRS